MVAPSVMTTFSTVAPLLFTTGVTVNATLLPVITDVLSAERVTVGAVAAMVITPLFVALLPSAVAVTV